MRAIVWLDPASDTKSRRRAERQLDAVLGGLMGFFEEKFDEDRGFVWFDVPLEKKNEFAVKIQSVMGELRIAHIEWS